MLQQQLAAERAAEQAKCLSAAAVCTKSIVCAAVTAAAAKPR